MMASPKSKNTKLNQNQLLKVGLSLAEVKVQ